MCVLFYLQVRELNTECIRMTTSYPGPSATAVANSMEEVQLAWEALQVSSSGRKKKLRAALELQKLLSSVSNAIGHILEYPTAIFSCVYL